MSPRTACLGAEAARRPPSGASWGGAATRAGAPGILLGGDLRRPRRASPALLEHGVHDPLWYQVAAALILVGLELAAVDHLPNAPVRYLEDPGGLAGRVGIFLHTNSIPL